MISLLKAAITFNITYWKIMLTWLTWPQCNVSPFYSILIIYIIVFDRSPLSTVIEIGVGVSGENYL